MHRQSVAENNQLRTRAPAGEDVDKPLVLFVCVHNAGRSRMAQAFFEQMAGDRYTALSAGTIPADHPHPEVVATMAEVGVDISDTPGTLLDQELVDAAVKVVSMGCDVEEACPATNTPMEDWALEDPKDKDPEIVAEIRDSIEIRVRNLIAKLDSGR